MTHPRHLVDQVLQLSQAGLNASEIARATGLARSTVRTWLGPRPEPSNRRWIACPRCNAEAELDEAAYVYVLGMYLGDGTISRQPREVWRLRIFQDDRYVELIEECVIELQLLLPNNVLVQQRPGCVEIGASSKHWPCLFPQAGPGRKHERPIVLEPWQQDLVDQYPKLLVRALFHSDGCRNLNFVTSHGRRYDYWRYTFSNASDDIRRICTDALDRLGVHWTQMNRRNIAVSRRDDVAFLDTFVGAKS